MFTRPLPDKESTARHYATKYAIKMFERFRCRKILDVGCGNAYLEETFPEKFVGIDIEEDRVKAAKERGLTNVFLGDATNLSFRDNSFDGVLAKDFLEHLYLEQAFQFIFEVQRILKKGGIFIATTFKNTQNFWDKPDHVRPYSNKWVIRVCEEELGSFEVIEKKDLSAGIPGFGRLHLEGLAHFLSDKLKVRADRGIVTLRLQKKSPVATAHCKKPQVSADHDIHHRFCKHGETYDGN